MSRVSGWLRQGAVQLTIVAVGLGVGLGAMALYPARTSGSGPSSTPSAKKFPFALAETSPLSVDPQADSAAGPDIEPVDAGAALTAFLAAEAGDDAGAAWALLDGAGRERWPTAEAWAADRHDRAPPATFTLTSTTANAAQGTPSEAVDLPVDVSRTPSLDPFRGLVAGRSAEVWRVHPENGHWRVAADPVESRPLLPPDTAAPLAVQDWVDRLAACDQPGAAAIQVDANLLGPADVAAAPCQRRGTWTTGDAVGIDRGGDVLPLLAAYGQDAASWARLVPVQGADRKFWAEVAPVGDAWMVVGVAAGG